MKKQILSLIAAISIGNVALAQTQQTIRRQPCNTFDAMEEAFKANPEQKKQYEASQAKFEVDYQNELQKKSNAVSKTAATVYTIPVVFHIMGSQPVSDQAFVNLISYFNNDFGHNGNDIATINSLFSGLYVDAEIRFALAQRDPNGNCTNGVIRHDNESIYWNQSSPAYNYSGSGANKWPTNKYLNIYIVECIASATSPCPPSGSYIAGYTYLPGTWATNAPNDAIVLLRNQLAQTDPHDSRTISHEIGHWLNLSHTFGNTNNPQFDPSNMPTTSITCSTDNVSDTPPTGGYFSVCNTSTLDCSNPPNIENIMDYASCPKMFTQGQITRMRTALTSATAGRNNLWTAANYSATGIVSGYVCSPIASIASNKIGACEGATVTYSSTSFVGENGGTYSWNFPGGTPSTSSNSVEAVTYPTAGTYSASLLVTNSFSNNTKSNYIVNITNGQNGAMAPSLINFETTGLPAGVFVRNDNPGSVTWIQNTAIGGNTTAKSIYINGFSSSTTRGNRDFFETPYYDFTSTTSIGLSYYYAYAKKVASQVDSFKVAYSLDCGATWLNIAGIPTLNTMATASGGTVATNFVPTSAQFKLATVNAALLTALANKPSVKLRFYFMSDKINNGSNNIYIDQINLTGSIATFISELEKTIGLNIYPNPTSGSSLVDFTASENDKVSISVTDIMGRIVEQSNSFNKTNGNVQYEINKNEHLAKGVYIVNITVNEKTISKKLILN